MLIGSCLILSQLFPYYTYNVDTNEETRKQ